MRTTTSKILAASVLAVAMAWMGSQASTGREKPELIYPHSLHSEMGIDCEMCHQTVGESTSGLDNLLPGMDVCGECHDIEDVDNCTLCHSDMDDPRAVPRVMEYSPKFNHQVHAGKELSCDRCHAGVAESETAATEHLPGMEPCMHCHDGFQAGGECILCHETERGKLPADHVSELWIRQHGTDARLDNGEQCSMCHLNNDCQECHQGDNLLNRVHPPGYDYRHPIDVRTGRIDCSSCHEDRSSCIECHTERNVYPLSHQRASWANTIPGSGGRHAVMARINMETCASCHVDEPDRDPVCAACHGM